MKKTITYCFSLRHKKNYSDENFKITMIIMKEAYTTASKFYNVEILTDNYSVSKLAKLGYNAKPVTDANELKSNILKQLESPVRWSEIISNMNRDGFTSYLEIGPGKVLQGLNRRILMEHDSSSIGTKEQLELHV